MKKRGWARGGANTERERGRENWKGRGRRGAAHPGRWEMCPIQSLAPAAHPDGRER